VKSNLREAVDMDFPPEYDFQTATRRVRHVNRQGGGAMASVKTPLVRKLRRVLSERFPSPATIKLEDHDGIIGVITSARFAKMATIDRQNLIGEIIATNLSQEERQRVQVIVGVTSDEGTGYLPGDD
jgi:hypothetical protein